MRLHSMLPAVVLALSPLTWAAEQATLPSISTSSSNPVLAVQLGPYPVSIYEHEVKTSRPDPFAPQPENRRLMIAVYRPFLDNFTCPLEHQSQIPYAPPVVLDAIASGLPSGPNISWGPISTMRRRDTSGANVSSILQSVRLMNCSRPVPSNSPSGPLPLFSPGFMGSHHGYAATLQAAASSGYTVVAIDPTYEAAAVVFPDGYVAYPSPAQQASYGSANGQDFAQALRIADAVSVLDAIERGEVPGLGQYSNSSRKASASPFVPLRTIMFGHSYGGSTAINVAAQDARVLAAVDMDGVPYPPVANSTVHKPVLLIQSAFNSPATWNYTSSHSIDFSTFYKYHLSGWRTWVRPNNSAHYGFTDLPLLADLVGLRGNGLSEELLGPVDSRRQLGTVWRYTQEFFAYVLSGETSDLLGGPSAEFPDVQFVGHAEAGKN